MIRLLSIFIFFILVFSIGCLSSGEETVVPAVTPTFVPTAVEKSSGTGHGDSHSSDATQSDKSPEEMFAGAICASCHKIEGTGAQGITGPDLTNIGTIGASRISGYTAEEYIRESIIEPDAYLVEGYGNLMPAGLKDLLGADYEPIITYLVSLK